MQNFPTRASVGMALAAACCIGTVTHLSHSQMAAPATQLTPVRPAASKYEAPPELQRPDLPSWAYTPASPPTPGRPRVPDDGTLLHVPGSDRAFTRTQINNGYGPPDWFPDQHPPAPKEVTEGRKPAYQACGLCHLPVGYGRPENQSVAGLSAAYMLQQLDDFKNERRHNSVPGMAGVGMIPLAKALTPEEAKEAVEYFASVKPVKWIRVVETDTVPKTHFQARMMAVDEEGGTEPIGNRVLEVAEDMKLAEMRDSGSGFIAYAPKGSLKRGEALVKTGGAGKVACVVCHGADLRGMGDIPRLAGRSPSQTARQLYDFKTGARNGANAALMKGPVSTLTDADIVNITAYLASLNP